MLRAMLSSANCWGSAAPVPAGAVGGASSYKTTTTTAREVRNSQAAEDRPALVYPACFTPEERIRADDRLAGVPAMLRQALLDELEGRIRTGQQGGEPVRSALGYLSYLCRRAQEGAFQPARGLKVQEERERRRAQVEQRQGTSLASCERPPSGRERYAQAPGPARGDAPRPGALRAASGRGPRGRGALATRGWPLSTVYSAPARHPERPGKPRVVPTAGKTLTARVGISRCRSALARVLMAAWTRQWTPKPCRA